MNKEELTRELSGRYGGTETVWKHSLHQAVTYTDGVRAFAQHAGGGAYWLLDILVTEPKILNEVKTHGFAVVTLTVKKTSAWLVVTDGGKNGDAEEVVYRRNIEFTDCPEGEWVFYFENMMILLPDER